MECMNFSQHKHFNHGSIELAYIPKCLKHLTWTDWEESYQGVMDTGDIAIWWVTFTNSARFAWWCIYGQKWQIIHNNAYCDMRWKGPASFSLDVSCGNQIKGTYLIQRVLWWDWLLFAATTFSEPPKDPNKQPNSQSKQNLNRYMTFVFTMT